MAAEGSALRKRQQIAKANRMMFLWVAGVSVVIGIAAVASLFLIKKAIFNERILSEKSKTASTLQKNNAAVEGLKEEIAVLNTKDALRENMISNKEGSQPVQVVLDALPATANSSAFGASLQQRFLQADSNIIVNSLTVDPVRDAEVSSNRASSQSASDSSSDSGVSEYRVRFSFDVSVNDANNAGVLKDLLVRLERSIRPITITSASIEAQGGKLSLKAEGYTYYQPERTVDLKDKVIRP